MIFESISSDIKEGSTVFKSIIDMVSARKAPCHKNIK